VGGTSRAIELEGLTALALLFEPLIFPSLGVVTREGFVSFNWAFCLFDERVLVWAGVDLEDFVLLDFFVDGELVVSFLRPFAPFTPLVFLDVAAVRAMVKLRKSITRI
jgi:hypothetical protein